MKTKNTNPRSDSYNARESKLCFIWYHMIKPFLANLCKIASPVTILLLIILIPIDSILTIKILSTIILILWAILIILSVISFILPIDSYYALKKQLRKFREEKKRLYTSLRGMREILQIFKKKIIHFFLFLLIVLLSAAIYYIGASILALGYLAYGLCIASFGFGLLLVPAHDLFSQKIIVEGFEPPIYTAILDYVFTDFFENWLEPQLWILFDEFLSELSMKVHGTENAKRIFEKYLLLEYLRILDIIERDKDIDIALEKELKRFIDDENMMKEIVEWMKERNPYLQEKIIRRVLNWFRRRTPGFTDIVDRMYTTLYENPFMIGKEQEVYVEISTQSSIAINKYLDLFVFMINRNEGENEEYLQSPRTVRIKVIADGFYPSYLEFTTDLEPLGDFAKMLDELKHYEIRLNILDANNKDVIGYLSRMFDVGDMVWIRLKPVAHGKRIIYITIEDEKSGKTLKTITCNVNVYRDLKELLRTLIGSSTIPIGIIYVIAQTLLSQLF